MFKAEQICTEILAEIEKEVTKFLATVVQDQPTGVAVELQAKDLGLRVAARLIEKSFALYGRGHQGQTLPCACADSPSPMVFIRYDTKTFMTVAGKIQATSAYYHCAICQQSRWPAFEQLGLGPTDLSEGARRLAAFAGAAEGGFERSRKLLKRLAGLDLSKNTLHRETENLGRQIKQQQEAELTEAVAAVSPAQTEATAGAWGIAAAASPLHVATDGTTVKTQTGKREVKSTVFYKVQGRKGQEARADEISYVSSFAKCEGFGQQVWQAALKRGVGSSELVVGLGDGANWIWNLYALHFPYRIEILDYYHASEHLALAAKAYFGESSPEAEKWHKKQAKRLLQKGGVQSVLKELVKLKDRRLKVRKVIMETIRYVENNVERMNYWEYRKKGYHIGSGLAESACKHLVGARLKKSGMTNWQEEAAEAVLQVRVAIENETLDQYCDQLLGERFRSAA
jgi:hypothetical protein